MICLIALVVFGVLGIFSATHRKIALEAFDCIFKRITIRPCNSGLDERLKSQIIGRLMGRSPKFARFSYRHFEAISWVFTILMVVSVIYSSLGIYSYVIYGNCNGENSQEACVYEGIGNTFNANVICESPSCQNDECICVNEIDCEEKEGELCKQSCYEEDS